MAEGDFSPQAIGVRLLAIALWLGKTQRELGAIMGYNDAQIGHCIHGRATPSDAAMLRLIKATKVGGDWIRFGLYSGLNELHHDRAVELLHYENAATAFYEDNGSLKEAAVHFRQKGEY